MTAATTRRATAVTTAAATTRPRLLHVTTTDMSLVLLLGPQLRAFADAGFEVHAASAPGPWTAELNSLGVTHHALEHSTRAVSVAGDLRAAAELAGLIRRLQPQIVHTHNPKPGIYGRLVARAAGVPVVVNTVHGLYAQPTDRVRKRALVYAAERLAAACSAVELVQNPEDLALLRRVLRVPPHRLRLLGNGIELDRFAATEHARADVRRELGATDDDVVALAVGRLVAEKGFPDLFDAVRSLAGSPVRLVVAGGAEPEKADGLGASTLDRAAAAGVTLLGHRPDVERLYAGADLFVTASRREGFPRAAMEAAATGLPIVATDIRGNRQVVQDGVTGILVPVGDPGALGEAIDRLAGDRSLRTAMGEAGRTLAAGEFDVRRVIRRTGAAYARALAGAGLAAPAAAAGAGEVRLRVADRSDLDDQVRHVASLHVALLPGSYLAKLGRRFLTRLYRRIVLHRSSFLLLAERDGELVGFCAGTTDTSSLYRTFLIRDGVPAALAASPRMVRSPRPILETLRYGRSDGEGGDAGPTAGELLSLAVTPDARRDGTGRALVTGCQQQVDGRGVPRVLVTVGSRNEGAIRLYRACGFSDLRTVDVHRGTSSLVLTWP